MGMNMGTVRMFARGALASVVLALSLVAMGRATPTPAVGADAGAGGPTGAGGGPTTLLFPGAQGLFPFGDKIAVVNPNPVTATVTLTYYARGRWPVARTAAYPPGARSRVEVAEQAFEFGLGNVYAVAVSSPARVAAANIRGYGHVAYTPTGAPVAGTTLYLAEGYLGPRDHPFKEYLTVFNPGRAAARVVVTAAPRAASAAGAPSEHLIVQPGDAVTRDLGWDFGPRAPRSFGLILTGDRPVVAVRAIRSDGAPLAPPAPTGEDRSDASTVGYGIARADTTLLFPYASATGPAFIAVLNPGRRPAAVRARFSNSAGRTVGTAALTVAPGTRGTLDLGAVGRSAGGDIYATTLTATSPIVAEETQYVGAGPIAGPRPGVVLPGVLSGATGAFFPDLDLRNPSLTLQLGEPKLQTGYLYNPTAAPITVTATYRADTGRFVAGYQTTVSKAVGYAVPAGGIAAVDVNRDAASIVTYRMGNGTLESTLDAAFAVTSGPGGRFVAASLTAPAP